MTTDDEHSPGGDRTSADEPVVVDGMDVTGFDLGMTAESVTVPPGERAAADVVLVPDCEALPDGIASSRGMPSTSHAPEAQPLTLDVATADGEHALDTLVAIGPYRAWRMFNAKCAPSSGMDGRVDIGITTVTDEMPNGSLPSRVHLTMEGKVAAGQVIEVQPLVPGYTLTTDSLPVDVGSPISTRYIDVVWSVDDCDSATSTESLRHGTHVGATIRAEGDGMTTPRHHHAQGGVET